MEGSERVRRRDSSAWRRALHSPFSHLHADNDVVSLGAMIFTTARYYFWYRYPKPAAEHGVRS